MMIEAPSPLGGPFDKQPVADSFRRGQPHRTRVRRGCFSMASQYRACAKGRRGERRAAGEPDRRCASIRPRRLCRRKRSPCPMGARAKLQIERGSSIGVLTASRVEAIGVLGQHLQTRGASSFCVRQSSIGVSNWNLLGSSASIRDLSASAAEIALQLQAERYRARPPRVRCRFETRWRYSAAISKKTSSHGAALPYRRSYCGMLVTAGVRRLAAVG